MAIKKLKPHTSDAQKLRLLQEGARMMQFFHSNVVTLHGMVTVGDMVGIFHIHFQYAHSCDHYQLPQ